ncbi:MAG: hypothetical protein MHM6MM_007871, partial [Cercozoa sp. M6MM]
MLRVVRPSVRVSFLRGSVRFSSSASTGGRPDAIALSLTVRDPEVIRVLEKLDETEQVEYATRALRLGVLALQTVQSQVDVDALQKEVTLTVQQQLAAFRRELTSTSDESGVIPRLSTAVASAAGVANADLLERLQATLRAVETLEHKVHSSETVVQQRIASAETLLVRQADLGRQSDEQLQQQLAEARRQVADVERRLQEGVSLQRSQVLLAVQDARAAVEALRNEVSAQQQRERQRVELEKRSTLHGLRFEEQLLERLRRVVAARQIGVVQETGQTPGLLPRCLKGDAVIRVRADGQQSDRRIVVEAKADRSYNMARALDEMREARKNRAAHVGIFVVAADTDEKVQTDTDRDRETSKWPAFQRLGRDIFVRWHADREDTTGVYLDAAVSLALALACEGESSTAETVEPTVDTEAIRRIAMTLEKQIRVATQLRSGAAQVVRQSDLLHATLSEQVRLLFSALPSVSNDTLDA